MQWVEEAIATTEAWIEREYAESRTELAFSAPGEWDYDYNTDVIRQTKQARETVEALEKERELIIRSADHLKRDTDDGKYDGE